MKELVLSNTEKRAIVDDIHYDRLSQYTWRAMGRGNKSIYRSKWINSDQVMGKYEDVALANDVMQDYVHMFDHKDIDSYNNLESNLRITTYSQNGHNRDKFQGVYTSKFKGVCWYPKYSKWLSRISVNKSRICLGYFDTDVEAAVAYNNAAIKNFGSFARLNSL